MFYKGIITHLIIMSVLGLLTLVTFDINKNNLTLFYASMIGCVFMIIYDVINLITKMNKRHRHKSQIHTNTIKRMKGYENSPESKHQEV